MKKTIKYMTMILAAAVLSGCSKDDSSGSEETDKGILNSIEYVFADPVSGTAPENGATFTFVSYNKTGEGSYDLIPNDGADQKPIGSYVWLADEEDKYHNILQPCEVDGDDYSFVKRNPQKGQALYNGDYMTVCLHPAVPVIGNGHGTMSVLFERDQVLMASEPFEMTVKGYQVFSQHADLTVTEIRSKVVLDFVQGTEDNELYIDDVMLVNPGAYGWYHPLTKTTEISYNPADKFEIYEYEMRDGIHQEVDLDVSNDDSDYDGSSQTDQSGDFDIYFTGEKGKDKTVYTTGELNADGLFFYANDYESDYFPQVGLAFEYYVNSKPGDPGAESRRAVIPLNLNMNRAECYRFRLVFSSSEIKVTYQIIPWTTVTDDDDDLGGNPPEITFGMWTLKGWEKHIQTEDIG